MSESKSTDTPEKKTECWACDHCKWVGVQQRCLKYNAWISKENGKAGCLDWISTCPF